MLPANKRQQLRAPVDLGLLHRDDVLDALHQVFLSKCAYCESKLSKHAASVSHFRPPSNASSSKNERDSPEHYSWLAYEWRNLLLLCDRCTSAKQNYFPVRTARAEPLTTWMEAQLTEHPLLLDPALDAPHAHISVDADGFLHALTERGKMTITVLALNRAELVRSRQAMLENLGEMLAQKGTDVDAMLATAQSADAEFGGIARLYLFGLCRSIELARHPRRNLPYGQLERGLARLRHELSQSEWRDYLGAHRYSEMRDSSDEMRELDRNFHDQKREQPILRKIVIQDFKGIESLTLDVSGDKNSSYATPPSAMLLGENAACKSTVLQAVALALMSKKERGRLRLAPGEFLPRMPDSWVPDYEKRPTVTLHFHDGATRTLEYNHGDDAFRDHSIERGGFTVLAYGARRFFQQRGRGRRAAPLNKTLFDPLSLLRDPSIWLEQADNHVFNAVVRAMRPVLSLRDDEDIIRLDDGRVMVSAHGRLTPIGQMSDGYRVLFAMATDIMRNMVEIWGNLEMARGIVLVDEIETHLHPRWKRRVMTALRAAMPRVQFIASTHDPLCLRGMRNGEAHVLYRDECGKVALVENLPDISTLRAEQILTSDYFGLDSTADPEQEQILVRLAELAGRRDGELNRDQRSERDRLLERFDGLPVIGDSVERQILAEAMTRHLRHQADRPTLAARAGQREDAINDIIAVLERAMAK